MKPMPECPVPIDLESSSVSGHDVRITVDEAVIDEEDGGECLKTPSDPVRISSDPTSWR